MGQAITSVQDMVLLAQQLRQSAEQTMIPEYREKMLRAAKELEVQVLLRASEFLPEASDSDGDDIISAP